MTVVRPADASDADAIARVHVASWRAAYAGVLPEPVLRGLSVDERAAAWQERIAAGTAVRVAVLAARVVAFASWGPDRGGDASAGELYALYADPAAWGTGAGRAVHDAAVAELLADHERALLWVLADNALGRGFYERRGWRPDGRRAPLDVAGTPVEELGYALGRERAL